MDDLNDKATGGVLTAAQWNQLASEVQNAITALGITLSGADLFQLSKAISGYAASGTFYTDGGIADAYVLSVIGSKKAPPSYDDGMQIIFKPSNDNTGASTVNVAGLGVVNIKLPGGANPAAGAIASGSLTLCVYDFANGWFELTQVFSGAAIPAGGISGLLWSNDTGGDVTNDFIISAGECRSLDDTTDLVLTSAQTKQMDAAWASGSGAGALATGATAWAAGVSYHVFIGLISGAVEIIVDSSVTAANAIANNGLTKPRHIFSFLAATGPALPILHTDIVGNDVRAVLDDMAQDVSDTGSTGGANVTLSVPIGLSVLAHVVYNIYHTTLTYGLITETRQTNNAPGAARYDAIVRANSTNQSIQAVRATDASGQIRYRNSVLLTGNEINTKGYVFIRSL